MKPNIIVIAEHFRQKIRPVSFELVSFALELQRLKGLPIKVIMLGDKIEEPAERFRERTGLDVIGIRHPGLDSFNGEVYKTLIGDLLNELDAAYVCIANTSMGMDIAPGLAVRLKAACVTGVERIFKEDEKICFVRTFFNGKTEAGILPLTERVVLTLQPGLFKAPMVSQVKAGSLEIRKAVELSGRSRSLGVKKIKEAESSLTGAEVIVSAGRGIGKKENLDLICGLAALFPRSAVAGSRAVCDAGWLEYKRQVGLTGATVSPKLYIACGISGAAQHLAGIRDAGVVVAINIDPNAAIFNMADICVVEDLNTFIPALVGEYQKM